MSSATLVTSQTLTDQTFAFEHMQAHRAWFGAMAPLNRFSVLPYLLDPMQAVNEPAGFWNLDHQQAHNDAVFGLPVPLSAVLVESDLTDEDQLTWWELQNLVEHQIADGVAFNQLWTFPFW